MDLNCVNALSYIAAELRDDSRNDDTETQQRHKQQFQLVLYVSHGLISFALA